MEGVFKQFIDTPVENELTIFKDAIYKYFDKFDRWFDAQWSDIEHIVLYSFPEGNITFIQGNRNTFFKKVNI